MATLIYVFLCICSYTFSLFRIPRRIPPQGIDGPGSFCWFLFVRRERKPISWWLEEIHMIFLLTMTRYWILSDTCTHCAYKNLPTLANTIELTLFLWKKNSFLTILTPRYHVLKYVNYRSLCNIRSFVGHMHRVCYINICIMISASG